MEQFLHDRKPIKGQSVGPDCEIKTIDQFLRTGSWFCLAAATEPYTGIARGEPNILTPDPVVYLNTSSGFYRATETNPRD